MRRFIPTVLLTALLIAGCQGTKEVVRQTPEASGKSALTQPLQIDSNVTIGHLENGLTYYIRKNHKPEDRAELRLVVNAGSVLENKDQQGLAHFTEHMEFNGTKHFPKQQLVNYLESIGMRFGADLNAYTSFDETVYMLEVPTDKPAVLDTAFQILEDWAHNASLDSTEIDKERGVIKEEWRLGRGANARMRDKQFPILFKGSRYAERLPIGDTTVVDTCHYNTLRRFYHTWYRPGLMAVIAVGDFNTDSIQQEIVRHFSKIPPKQNPRERKFYPVPEHDSTLYAIASDPEATRSTVSIYYKMPVKREKTVRDYRESLVENAYNGMLNNRLDEIAQQPDAPFLYAYSGKGDIVRTKAVYLLSAGVKDNGIDRGLKAILTEADRVEQYGFTPTELERYKKQMLRQMQQAYSERDKTNSRSYASEYIRNFLEEEPIPGIEREYQLYQKYVPTIALDEVNHVASTWISDSNRVIMVNVPEKDSVQIPTKNELASVLQSVNKTDIQPYQDKVANRPLVEHTPEPVAIADTDSIPAIGITTWTLKNGIRVILKPTDFKNNEVRFTAFSPGGLSLVPDTNYVAGETASGVITNAGLDGFTYIQLQKYLSDKVVNVHPYISDLQEGLSGSAAPEDLATLFQMIYLYFTAPRVDSSAYLAYKSQLEGWVQNRSARPEAVFSDTLQNILSQHHYSAKPWSPEILKEMDLGKSYRIYHNRFADASDFTFIFVGSFSLQEMKPLAEQYLANLPSTHRNEQWKDMGVRYPQGQIQQAVRKGLEPKSRVELVFTGKFDWTRENRFDLDAMGDVLRIKLREVLREDKGGTYGVGVGTNTSHYPNQDYRVTVAFGCAPDRVDELIRAVYQQIDSLKSTLVKPEYLEKVSEIDRRTRETSLKQNGFWVNTLESYYFNGEDPVKILDYDQLVDHLTREAIQKAAQTYLNENNVVKVVLYPQEGAGEK